MVKVVLILCTSFGIMDAGGTAYKILFSLADSFFHFLPVFLAWSAAVRLECSVPLFMTIGAALCYPDLIALMGGSMAAACIGAGVGGIISGIAEVRGYVLGSSPSVFSLVTFVGGDPQASFGTLHGVVFGAIAGSVTIVTAFLLSYMTAGKGKKIKASG
ncbi:MAG: hypothetical protein ABS879_02595 [Eubacteriales bacterium]